MATIIQSVECDDRNGFTSWFVEKKTIRTKLRLGIRINPNVNYLHLSLCLFDCKWKIIILGEMIELEKT